MSYFPLAQWADEKPSRWIFIWCALVLLVVLGSSLSAPDFSKPQVTPVIQQPIQVTQLEAMQEQVGPEGICTETAKKVICKNKHGQKVINKSKE